MPLSIINQRESTFTTAPAVVLVERRLRDGSTPHVATFTTAPAVVLVERWPAPT